MTAMTLTLREFLYVEPLTSSYLLTDKNMLDHNIVAADLLKLSYSEIVNNSKQYANKIIFLKDCDISDIRSNMAIFTEANCVIVISDHALTDLSLLEQYNFVKLLKETDKLVSFIELTINSMLKLLQEQGIHYMWSYLERKLAVDLYIFNDKYEPLLISEAMAEKYIVNSEGVSQQKQLDLASQLTTANDWTLNKIIVDGQAVYFGCEAKLQEIDVAFLRSVLPIIALELERRNQLLAVRKLYKKNYLYDLLHNNLEESQTLIVEQAKLWGWDMNQTYDLMIVEIHNEHKKKLTAADYSSMRLLIKNKLSKHYINSIVEELNGQLIVMSRRYQEAPTYDIVDLANVICQKIAEIYKKHKLRIGIGRHYNQSSLLYRSYQEAKTALELGKYINNKNVTHYNDLGVMRLLANIRTELLEDFHQEYLEDLQKFDLSNEMHLLDTLRIYFIENGNVKATAQKLFIHTNTLRYRLKKIEEILAVNLQDHADLVNLYIAVMINSLTTKQS